MDNVVVSCTVGDEEALVDKANSCTGSRRFIRQKMRTEKTVEQPQQMIDSIGMSKFCLCNFWYRVIEFVSSLNMNPAKLT